MSATIWFGFVLGVLGWVVQETVVPVLVLSKNKILEYYQRFFGKRNILILGAPESGKTSLVLLLTKGEPYYLDDQGRIQKPDRTVGVALIDESITGLNLTQLNERDQIPADVGGEFHEQWKQLIRDTNPHGIIYMVDARLDEEALEQEVGSIFEYVLSQYPTGIGHSLAGTADSSKKNRPEPNQGNGKHLLSVHIFLNYMDQLDAKAIQTKPYQVAEWFKQRLESPLHQHIQTLQWGVSIIQLSPLAIQWSEAELALEKFGNSLK
ncbi:MAG: hypothetical protein AAF639_37065 [Chloroflexota bacterium]